MLSAEAYSFRQQARLAISLSLVGGFTNAVAFVAAGNFASHVTGHSTMVGIRMAGGARDLLFYAGMVGSFLLGAVTSAVMTELAKRRGAASKYVWPLTVEAGLLVVLMGGLNAGWAGTGRAGAAGTVRQAELLFLAAYAMGLQNATITKISGAVVRSTHLTGVVTDLGIESVQLGMYLWDRLRGRWWQRAGRVLRVSQRHPTVQRVALLGSIWGSFVCGATLGAVLFAEMHGNALAVPAAFLVGILWMSSRAPVAEIREMDVVGDPEMKLHGILQTLLPAELGVYRVTHDRRAGVRSPNFNMWVERVPAGKRVVVLVLSPVVRFDTNAILDLQRAVGKLEEARRELVLAGVNTAQYKQLEHEGMVATLGAERVCPDLEFAIGVAVERVREMKRETRG